MAYIETTRSSDSSLGATGFDWTGFATEALKGAVNYKLADLQQRRREAEARLAQAKAEAAARQAEAQAATAQAQANLTNAPSSAFGGISKFAAPLAVAGVIGALLLLRRK